MLRIFQVDAFTDHLFGGNPAAVCPLTTWPEDALLQAIAAENNLSETAFFVAGQEPVELRWFTPVAEVDLCGHATLAAAHVLFVHLGQRGSRVRFSTRSGVLVVTRTATGYALDFPAAEFERAPPLAAIGAGLGATPAELWTAFDYLAVFEREADVRALEPDFAALAALDLRGVIATAPGESADFVSRCFYPKYGIDEDPVTGSAHCVMAPYWQQRLGRRALSARQLSRRGGVLECRLDGERVILIGSAVDFMHGELAIEAGAPVALRA